MKIKLNTFAFLLALVLAIANIAGLFYLAGEVVDASSWRKARNGSYSAVEAAFLGALWTSIAAKACMGILLNAVALGWIFLNVEIYDRKDDRFRENLLSEVKALREQQSSGV